VSREDPELIDRLASEYVLGTLRGPARRRFERWRVSSAQVDERCRFWEDQLLPLARGLRPVQPPAHVWQSINARLDRATPAPRRSALGRTRTRLFAIAASILLVAGLGTLLYWRALQPGEITQLATIRAASGPPAWTVEIHGRTPGSAQLVVRTGTLPARPAGRDYELWALPTGARPVSLGVLPAAGGTARHALSAAQLSALAGSMQLAVSVEPVGGSPTGQPTGPVVLTAPLGAVS